MMSVLRSHNNKSRGGLGRVCATGIYRSIELAKFPKFQTGIFVEWKAPTVYLDNDFFAVMYQTLRLLGGAFLYCFCSTVIRICLYCQEVPRLFTYRYLVFFVSRLSTSRMKIKVLTASAGVWG